MHHVLHPRRTVWRTLVNAAQALLILLRHRPRLIISTGADVAVPILVLGKLVGARIVFIETGGSLEPTLAGRLVYPDRRSLPGPVAGEAASLPPCHAQPWPALVIIVAVGTFVHGFDELRRSRRWRLRQTGTTGAGADRPLPRPTRWLTWQRFLAPEALRRALGGARIVVCHGGMGLLGDAMRAGRPIVAVPRRGPPSRDHPAGDQLPFLRRLAEIQPIYLCEHLSGLEAMLQRIASADGRAVTYDLETDLPERLAAYLQTGSTS